MGATRPTAEVAVRLSAHPLTRSLLEMEEMEMMLDVGIRTLKVITSQMRARK